MGERMKDKVVLVSGAGSALDGWGNGKAAAVLYAREGASVLLADISEYAVASTKQVIESEGGASEVFIGDVTKAADVEAMVARCVKAYGRIDVLHNNHAIFDMNSVDEMRRERC